MDGATKGPVGFTGPLGKQLRNCELLQTENFSSIEIEEINVPDERELITNQKHLLNSYEEIRTGPYPDDISCILFTVDHATDNRFLHL